MGKKQSPMEKKQQQQSSNKKSRVESPMAMGQPSKTEEEILNLEEDEETSSDALVAVEGAAAGVDIMIRIAKAKLHRPTCTLPLKPPIFQCAAGHMACGFCRDQLSGDGRCFVCGHAGGAYSHRNSALEDVVRAARIRCPYEAYGCRSYVTYYHAVEHQRSCPHAPCLCSEPGCGGFAGTPAALRDHLRDAHAWPVDKVRYGAALQLRVPEGSRRLLVADADGEGEDDGAVFLLAVSGAFGDARLRTVSLVCARPSAAAVVGPRYACWMRAVAPDDVGTGGDAENAAVELTVPRSAAPGEASMEEAATMVVLRRMMHGAAAEEKELHIGIRIERIV